MNLSASTIIVRGKSAALALVLASATRATGSGEKPLAMPAPR
jgi:hypothetical protein